MLPSIEKQIPLIPFYLVFIVLTIVSLDNIFFWDTVQLGSMHAHHFFNSNFSEILLPDQFDSGHIPSFGMYLAVLWKIFGKELWISHLAMLPFLLGIVWQAFRLVRHYIKGEFKYFALLLLLADPTLLGQSVLISPDIVLMFVFLLAVNSVLRNERKLLLFAILGLFLISMRGMMVAFAILLFDLYLNAQKKESWTIKNLSKMSLAYWPAVLIAGSYFLFHYSTKGWIAYHPDSPWAASFERVDLKGFLYNIGILGWRILDFGRVIFVAPLIIFALTRVGSLIKDKLFRELFFLLSILVLCLGYSFTSYKYLSAHRYLMPLFAILSLTFSYLLFNRYESIRFKKWLFGIVLFFLISGNFWIYPEGIAQGWDANLAHWPYYELRDKMIEYIEDKHIDYPDVAAEFPNVSERRFMELNESHERHQYLNLDSNEYVLYSNIYNNIDENEIEKLKKDYILLKSFEKRGVFIQLYKK